ncbi:dihydropteroate synthase [Microbacterium caowuchunii]|uniref:dihydropteroate synthase n=1 Tax=Microbacterium caowuchunii TaxID=2614638 RepID=UPI0012485478|nr:dihydropteroate synthase [Microbacterium caowuchunii]QEV98869.1 dihydropteroate synthase [Microbacterium caowuchunii]
MACLIMGIVNVTPDSFSDGGRHADPESAVAHGLRLREQGAAILDVGGESTRPGSARVSVEEEQERVIPVVYALAELGAVVSIDTMNASTASAAIAAGARIVNDVSGGLADPDLLPVVAESRADIVLGHWRGHSDRMYAQAEYRDITREVVGELRERLSAAAAAGIAPSRVILDPGIGFAKRGAQNWELLRGLPHLVGAGARVLVGTSRKRFLADVLGEDASEERRDLATAVTSVLSAQAGAWAVRVHDVPTTRDALRVAEAWKSGAA